MTTKIPPPGPPLRYTSTNMHQYSLVAHNDFDENFRSQSTNFPKRVCKNEKKKKKTFRQVTRTIAREVSDLPISAYITDLDVTNDCARLLYVSIYTRVLVVRYALAT